MRIIQSSIVTLLVLLAATPTHTFGDDPPPKCSVDIVGLLCQDIDRREQAGQLSADFFEAPALELIGRLKITEGKLLRWTVKVESLNDSEGKKLLSGKVPAFHEADWNLPASHFSNDGHHVLFPISSSIAVSPNATFVRVRGTGQVLLGLEKGEEAPVSLPLQKDAAITIGDTLYTVSALDPARGGKDVILTLSTTGSSPLTESFSFADEQRMPLKVETGIVGALHLGDITTVDRDFILPVGHHRVWITPTRWRRTRLISFPLNMDVGLELSGALKSGDNGATKPTSRMSATTEAVLIPPGFEAFKIRGVEILRNLSQDNDGTSWRMSWWNRPPGIVLSFQLTRADGFIVGCGHETAPLRFYDDGGKPLMPNDKDNGLMDYITTSPDRRSAIFYAFARVLPPAEAVKLHLRGNLNVRVARATEKAEAIVTVGVGNEFTLHGVRVKISSVEQHEGFVLSLSSTDDISLIKSIDFLTEGGEPLGSVAAPNPFFHDGWEVQLNKSVVRLKAVATVLSRTEEISVPVNLNARLGGAER